MNEAVQKLIRKEAQAAVFRNLKNLQSEDGLNVVCVSSLRVYEAAALTQRDVSFFVDEEYKQECQNAGKRCGHAWTEGLVVNDDPAFEEMGAPVAIVYDRVRGAFMCAATQQTVAKADVVKVFASAAQPQSITAYGVTYGPNPNKPVPGRR